MTRKQDRSTIDLADWRKRLRPAVADRAEYRCESCHSIKTNRERWDGHKRKDRNAVRRARVTGRGAFLQALQEGGA